MSFLFYLQQKKYLHIRFYAGYPLSAPDGSKVGTLCVIDREPRELSDEDMKLLEELGRMVEEELAVADLMHNDAVTGLSNTVGFSQIAEYLLAMCVRTESPAALLLCHWRNQPVITGFMGQAEGDRAAVEMTQLLMASFRDSDIIGRISDDTFAVLLAGAPIDNVRAARNRLEKRIDDRNARGKSEYELEVELSAIAYDRAAHDSVDALLEDAHGGLESEFGDGSDHEDRAKAG